MIFRAATPPVTILLCVAYSLGQSAGSVSGSVLARSKKNATPRLSLLRQLRTALRCVLNSLVPALAMASWHASPVASKVQVALHPSPLAVFPSSHCSPGSSFPLPQTGGTGVEVTVGIGVQVEVGVQVGVGGLVGVGLGMAAP